MPQRLGKLLADVAQVREMRLDPNPNPNPNPDPNPNATKAYELALPTGMNRQKREDCETLELPPRCAITLTLTD